MHTHLPGGRCNVGVFIYGDLTPGANRALRLFRLYCTVKGFRLAVTSLAVASLGRGIARKFESSSQSKKISAHSKARDSADAVTYRLDQGSPPDRIDRGHCILDSPRCVATGDRDDMIDTSRVHHSECTMRKREIRGPMPP